MRRLIAFITIIGLIAMFSCKKDETKVFIKANPTSSALTNPGDIVLTLADSANNITFKWTSADFGFPAMVNYSLQIDKKSNAFSNPLNIATITSDTTAMVNSYALDNMLRSNEYDTVATASQMRVMAILKGTGDAYAYTDTVYSEPVDLNITPFDIVINYPKLYVPGDYNGWTFVNSIASVKSNDKYEGYIFMHTSGTIKFTKIAGWEQFSTYGDADASGTSGTLVNDWGNNIYVADSGYYKINVDVNALTYYLQNTDWAIAGDFNGWADTPMQYNRAEDVWTVTMDMTAGGLKFKLNGDSSWSINYGDTGADGKLDQGGDNISIPSDGNYTITLDLSKPVYTYKIVKN